MKTIVAGGRDFKPGPEHAEWLKARLKELGTTTLLCGMCRGADLFGYYIAANMGIPVEEYPAQWGVYGASAGPIRNKEMADAADACILFPGGKGSQNMKKLALEKGLKVIEYGD